MAQCPPLRTLVFTADAALKDEATQRIVNTFPILFEADMLIMGTGTKFSHVLR